MRRTTLGPITSSQINSRPSLGGGARQSLGISKVGRLSISSTKNPRSSIQPSSSARSSIPPSQRKSNGGTTRRSSVYGGGTRAADPRPVNDRSFINACIRNLIEYLSSHQYDHALSPKLLTRPTKKDFHNIVQFLVRRVDPKYTFGEKFEEEFINIYRLLRYPFGISKTALVAVGSPHTWPALLASVTWLIELLCYAEEAEVNEIQPRDFENDGNEKVFFDYLSKAYRAFLSGNDDHYAALEEELVKQFETRDHDIEEEVKSIQQQNDELRAEIQELKATKSSIPMLQSKRKDLLSDLDKFKTLIAQLENHKESLQKKIKERKFELRAKDEELRALEKDVSYLQTVIDNQEMSAADVERIKKERARLLEQVAALTASKEQGQRVVWETEQEVVEAKGELEKTVGGYNALASKLQVIPAKSKYAFGQHLELAINKRCAPGSLENPLSVDFKATLKPGISKIKTFVAQRMHDAQDQILELQAVLENQQEISAEAQEDVRNLESKLKKLEDTYKREKEALDRAVHLKVAETEELEIRIQELRDGTELDSLLGQNTDELQQLKTRRQENRARFEKEKEKVQNKIMEILYTCTDQKGYVEAQLRALEAYHTAKLAAVSSSDGSAGAQVAAAS